MRMKHSMLRGMPPTENFIAALVASRLGSFSGAAVELGLTHSAVSRRIAVLEAWMGTVIFERQGRGVSPTADGQRVLARLSATLSELSSLRRGRTEQRLPTLKIAVTPAFARFWLLPRLREIEGHPPSVRIEVIADLKHADLVRAEVDLAVRYGRTRLPSTQNVSVHGWRVGNERRLFSDPLVPVIARSLLHGVRPMEASEVLKSPLLHSGDTTAWQTWTRLHFPAGVPKPAGRIFSDYSLTVDAATSGLGVALWDRGLHKVPDALVALDNFQIDSQLGFHLLSRLSDADGLSSEVAARILAAC